MTPAGAGGPPPMKPLEFSVLLVLAEGPEYGYGIVKRIAEEGAGRIHLAPSNLYYVLDRMLEMGVVEPAPEPDESSDAVSRRYYRITGAGRVALREEAVRLAEMVERAARLRLLPRAET